MFPIDVINMYGRFYGQLEDLVDDLKDPSVAIIWSPENDIDFEAASKDWVRVLRAIKKTAEAGIKYEKNNRLY